MKILLIGGTGTISTAISKQLAESGHTLYLLNRGSRNNELPAGIHFITGDIGQETEMAAQLKGLHFDVVCDFIGFVPSQLERDYRLFRDKTDQFVYISSASAYHKPVRDYVIQEGTTLANPYWQYSRNKIACEDYLLRLYREEGFPVTIVRPSHTYCERAVPLGLHGANGSWQVVQRMLEGKPVLIHGDGTSLWTMTHNSDFATGFIGLLGNPHAIGEAFHITSDESLTWNQIYQTIASHLSVPFKPYYVSSAFLAATAPKEYDLEGGLLGDKSNTVVFDNSKLKRIVPQFHAAVRFETGVGQALDYVRTHADCQLADPAFDRWSDAVIAAQEHAKEAVLAASLIG